MGNFGGHLQKINFISSNAIDLNLANIFPNYTNMLHVVDKLTNAQFPLSSKTFGCPKRLN